MKPPKVIRLCPWYIRHYGVVREAFLMRGDCAYYRSSMIPTSTDVRCYGCRGALRYELKE